MPWITDQTGISPFDAEEFSDAYSTVSALKVLSISRIFFSTGNSAAYNYLKKNSSSSSLIPVL